MFQQQQQAQMHQQQQQRKEPNQFISAEAQAREKLSHFVYEYLVHMGASKTADMFKNEVLAQSINGTPNIQIDISASPGFLSNWFSVFWDLYSVHPDKKDKAEPSNDAKTYHKMLFPASGFPEGMVNGGGIYGPPGFHNQNLGQMGGLPMPPSQNMPDGMFPGYFNGTRGGPQPGPSQSSNQASPIPGGPPNRFGQQQGRSGAPTPSNSFQPPHQMNANQLPMNDHQMRLVMAQQQRQAAQQGRMPMGLQLAGHLGRQQMRQFCPPQQYMDSPSGTPPFPGSLPHNGTSVSAAAAAAMCSSSASLMSPSAGVPSQQQIPPGALMGGGAMPGQMQGPSGECGAGGGPGSADANYMMMGAGGGPGMQSQFLNHNDGGNGGGAGVSSVNSIRQQIDGSNSTGGDLNTVGNVGGTQQQSSQLHSLLNGTGGGSSGDMSMEIKHSPSSVHQFGGGGSVPCQGQQQCGGINGGTPTGGGGPLGSVGGPSSVHSQQSGSNNKMQQPPITESLEIGGHMGNQNDVEISKIKASLMEGFPESHQFQQ